MAAAIPLTQAPDYHDPNFLVPPPSPRPAEGVKVPLIHLLDTHTSSHVDTVVHLNKLVILGRGCRLLHYFLMCVHVLM